MQTRRHPRAAALLALPAAILGLQAAAPGGAAAQTSEAQGSEAQQSEMVWVQRSHPADDRGPASATLTLGVPETDAVQLVARCGPGPGGVQVEIAADIGTAAEGSPVDIRFGGPSLDLILQGTVVGTAREVGVVGVRLDLPADDALWQAFRAGPAVTYGVAGGPQTDLPLAGSSEPISRFLEECQAQAADDGGGAAPDGADTDSAPDGAG